MLNENALLVKEVWEPKDAAPTRDGFGKGVVEAGKDDTNVVVLTADLAGSTRAAWFAEAFPDRFVQMGVAEQNMATVASGMAAYGKIPFFTSYASFSPGRNWEQIRTTIALNDVPAVVCGMHAGVSVGPDGATHQMLEDIALMRAMPNMQVISPCDAEEARKATIAVAKSGKPAYMRFHREKTPIITTTETPFELGKAYRVWQSEHPVVALVATGPLLHNALLAAKTLQTEGVGSIVLNVHTVDPLDTAAVVAVAKKCGTVVTIEEHQVTGGLGGAVAECLATEHPTKMAFVGVQHMFGQSGAPAELIEHYGMGSTAIIKMARQLLLGKG